MTARRFYIYEHWRPDRGRCFYVGKGNGRRAHRLDKSSERNAHHKAIQEKLAALGLSVEVRIVTSGLTDDEAYGLEIERIAFWAKQGIRLANHTGGGEGLKRPSDETRRKMGAWQTGRKLSAQHRANLRRPKIRTPEHAAKIAAALRNSQKSAAHMTRMRAIRMAVLNSPEYVAARTAANESRRIEKQREKLTIQQKRARLVAGVQRMWDEMRPEDRIVRAAKSRASWAKKLTDGGVEKIKQKIRDTKARLATARRTAMAPAMLAEWGC